MATRLPISNQATINLRLDSGLKASLLALAEAENLTASELVRELLDKHVRATKELTLRAEIRRELDLIAQSEDEEEVMRWIEDVAALDDE